MAVIERDERLLIIRQAEGIAAPGAYCFPGGGIEKGETEAEALVRERGGKGEEKGTFCFY